MWKLRTSFSLKPFILYITTESDGSVYSTSFPGFSPTRPYGEREGRARVGRIGRVGERTWERGCGLFKFSSRRQVSRKYNLSMISDIPSSRRDVCLKFRLRFSSIDFHRFPLPIDNTWLLTIFIDFDFYVTTPRSTSALVWKGGRWAPTYTKLTNISRQKILKKR